MVRLPMNQKATPVKAWMNGLRFRVPPHGGILKKKAPRLSSRGAPHLHVGGIINEEE